jgi:hypothetical protein
MNLEEERKRKLKRRRLKEKRNVRKEKEENNFLGILLMSKPGKSLKRICKRLGVRLTVKRGKKRVYKSVKVLKRQCANKKKKKKVKRKRKFGKKRKQKLTKKSFFNLISKIMSVITIGTTFYHLINDISKTHRRLKQDRTETQKQIDETIKILKNNGKTFLLDQEFQFQAFEAKKKVDDYFGADRTVHSGYDSIQDFIDYLNNGERRKTEQSSLLGGLTLVASIPFVSIMEMFRPIVTGCGYFRSDDYTISILIQKLGYENPMKTNSFGLLPTMEDFDFKEKPFYNEGDLTQLIINLFKKLGIYVTYTIARKVLFAIVLSRFHCLNEHLKSMLEQVTKIKRIK